MASSPTTTTPTAAANTLQDRVAIVTGASRGIGKVIALHLASLGAKLVINYTSPSSKTYADQLVCQINSLTLPSITTLRAIAIQADVSDEFQVKALFNTAEQTFNTQPHIVVTSAGIFDSKYSSLFDIEASHFDRIFGINTRGTFLCIKEAANSFKRGGGGRIVTMSSSAVRSLKEKYGAYAASKAAVNVMTTILAKELKGSGITVNAVAPGPVATEMFFEGKTEEMVKKIAEECPLKRLGKVEDVGFLASDAGEWVNGQVIRVNGGYV
ncbi:NADPH-dependent aldehyde reductase-like protein, chloroplastic [Chenopodium quinoa]|uniref:NADPH-dependent aldehyde reductase-like protein, chloroplastic n=1 Tax=Chenopodium quinoa TaxID=63459 RepID=UPI000B7888AE|nr:NADPH-dependent aldehyde reductase-like protein, chloroplastic [Chenopodium quinoa]